MLGKITNTVPIAICVEKEDDAYNICGVDYKGIISHCYSKDEIAKNAIEATELYFYRNPENDNIQPPTVPESSDVIYLNYNPKKNKVIR